jgi:hypothetical protein
MGCKHVIFQTYQYQNSWHQPSPWQTLLRSPSMLRPETPSTRLPIFRDLFQVHDLLGLCGDVILPGIPWPSWRGCGVPSEGQFHQALALEAEGTPKFLNPLVDHHITPLNPNSSPLNQHETTIKSPFTIISPLENAVYPWPLPHLPSALRMPPVEIPHFCLGFATVHLPGFANSQ